MPESRHKFLYERLGDHDFQLLVNALLTVRFRDFVPLPLRQSDGGRDGVLGSAPQKMLVYQVKWSADGTNRNPVSWLDATVLGEEDNLRRLASEGVRRYVLVTNVSSTGKAKTGTFDRLRSKLETHAKKFGFEEMTCLWREAVDAMVDGAPREIKWQYPGMLAGWDAIRPLISGAAMADWPMPQQLPPAPPGFVGRQPALSALTEAASRSADGTTAVISTLTGLGGIGKTSVALHWAHSHAEHYRDGQLYVDLHGFSPAGEPITTSTALRGLLHALGVNPGRIPDHVDAQAALYRSLVAGKQMLVVLDNAATVEQVVPLLPGSASSMVLVTSRHRLTGLTVAHGANPIRVDVLTEVEARALLDACLGANRVAAEPAAADALLVACCGLPLALAIVAGHARVHPELTLSSLGGELCDTATRLDALDTGDPATSLGAVLSWSYDALTPGQQEAFALLGLAPGPNIGLLAAASLVGLPELETRRLLTTLNDASLIDCDGRGRYRMHDLVRAYAATIAKRDLTQQAREHALRRLLDFYVHTAHKADQLLHPQRRPIELTPSTSAVCLDNLRDTSDALAWFTVEHPQLLAAQRFASTLQWWRITWQLAWVSATYLQRRGYGGDRVTVWTAAVDAAIHIPDPPARIRAHRHLGHAYADLDQLKDAFENLNCASKLAQEHGDTVQQAHIHRTLAWMWERAEEYQPALDHAKQALILYRVLGRPADEATALNQVGWLSMWCLPSVAAREHCKAALILHRRHQNPDGEAHTLDSLGWIAQHSALHHQAVNYYKQALRIHRALGNTYSVANTLDRLGVPYKSLRLYEAARTTWEEALTLYRKQERSDIERVQKRLDFLDRLTRR